MVTIGNTDEQMWSLAFWYIQLLSFYRRRRDGAEPFFANPRKYPDGPEDVVGADGAWLYRDALKAFHDAQSAVGIADEDMNTDKSTGVRPHVEGEPCCLYV